VKPSTGITTRRSSARPRAAPEPDRAFRRVQAGAPPASPQAPFRAPCSCPPAPRWPPGKGRRRPGTARYQLLADGSGRFSSRGGGAAADVDPRGPETRATGSGSGADRDRQPRRQARPGPIPGGGRVRACPSAVVSRWAGGNRRIRVAMQPRRTPRPPGSGAGAERGWPTSTCALTGPDGWVPDSISRPVLRRPRPRLTLDATLNRPRSPRSRSTIDRRWHGPWFCGRGSRRWLVFVLDGGGQPCSGGPCWPPLDAVRGEGDGPMSTTRPPSSSPGPPGTTRAGQAVRAAGLYAPPGRDRLARRLPVEAARGRSSPGLTLAI